MRDCLHLVAASKLREQMTLAQRIAQLQTEQNALEKELRRIRGLLRDAYIEKIEFLKRGAR